MVIVGVRKGLKVKKGVCRSNRRKWLKVKKVIVGVRKGYKRK